MFFYHGKVVVEEHRLAAIFEFEAQRWLELCSHLSKAVCSCASSARNVHVNERTCATTRFRTGWRHSTGPSNRA
jgi:hypothetical protein